MNRSISLKIQLELAWWVFTAIAVVLVLLPIWREFDQFPFLVSNVLFIVLFITYTRYVFLLKHTWLANLKYLKGALVFVSIPLIFFTVEAIHGLQVFLDEEGQEALFSAPYMKELPSIKRQNALLVYIKREYFFFGTGLVIAAIAFPIRMLVSIWRQINRNKV